MREDEDIYSIVESLIKIAALRPKKMFCTFTGVIDMAAEAIDRKIDYLEDLKTGIEQGVQQSIPFRENQRRLLGKGDRYGLLTAGQLSKQNLIDAFLRVKRGEG